MAVRPVPSRNRSTVMLSKQDLQFAISQLRMDKVIFDLHAIVVSFISVLTAVFLPEVLYRVVFKSGESGADLSVLSWIPVIAYIVAALFTIFTCVTNWMRWMKIKRLERDLVSA